MKHLMMTLLVFLGLAATAKAEIRCTSDFSAIAEKEFPVWIKIKNEGAEKLEGVIVTKNSFYTFKNGVSRYYYVRQGLDYSTEEVGDRSDLNTGESTVAFLASYLNTPELKDATKITADFDLKDVYGVKLYDLVPAEFTTKLGGTRLVDFYNKDQKLLGRYFQGFMINNCK